MENTEEKMRKVIGKMMGQSEDLDSKLAELFLWTKLLTAMESKEKLQELKKELEGYERGEN